MSLTRRVLRAGAVLDRLPVEPDGDPLPDELVPYALELRDAHEAVEHARQHASYDELDGGLWDRLGEDAFHAAHRFDIEVRRLEGEDVSWRERQLEQWREERDLEDAVPFAERIAAVTVEPEPEIPDAVMWEVEQAAAMRRAQREALGVPTAEHRELSEHLRRRFGRAL